MGYSMFFGNCSCNYFEFEIFMLWYRTKYIFMLVSHLIFQEIITLLKTDFFF